VIDAVGIVAVGRRVAGDADGRAPSGAGVGAALIAEFELRRPSDDAVLDADVGELIGVAFVAELPTVVSLSVGLPRQTLLQTTERIVVLVALVAESLQRRIPRQTVLVAPRGIRRVRTLVAKLLGQWNRHGRARQNGSQYEI